MGTVFDLLVLPDEIKSQKKGQERKTLSITFALSGMTLKCEEFWLNSGISINKIIFLIFSITLLKT